jgi:hypothetical protein
LPPFVVVEAGGFNEPPYMARLRQRIERGVPAPSKSAAIESCRALERQVAAKLEERAREAEEEKKEAEREERRSRQAEEQAQAAIHAREKAQAEAVAAERNRREKLANDYQARRTG